MITKTEVTHTCSMKHKWRVPGLDGAILDECEICGKVAFFTPLEEVQKAVVDLVVERHQSKN